MVSLFQLLLILVVQNTKSESCNGNIDCHCSNLTQSTGNTCTLNCDLQSVYGCKSSTLTCRSGDPCIIRCDADHSCQYAVIDGSKATDVTVYCSQYNSCKSNTIHCGSGDCLVDCSADNSCQYAVINGSKATDVTTYCSQNLACNSNIIHCGNGDCLLNCNGTEPNICTWLQVTNNNEARSFRCVGNHCDKLTSAPPEFSPSPTNTPSLAPTTAPSLTPTNVPSNAPSANPTTAPSLAPTIAPSQSPSQPPTIAPSLSPSLAPSRSPSQAPTIAPSLTPSIAPSLNPTISPSTAPSLTPTNVPTFAPTLSPSVSPSYSPTIAPSLAPSLTPSTAPTLSPSLTPSNSPSQPPSIAPSLTPSVAPSLNPSIAPSTAPSLTPTNVPSLAPTFSPSLAPTLAPSLTPSGSPSQPPSTAPSVAPSLAPTAAPSTAPTVIGTQLEVEIFIYYDMSRSLTNIILSVFNEKLAYATFLGIKYGAYEYDYEKYKFLYDAYTCVAFTVSSFNDPNWDNDLFDCDVHEKALAKNKKDSQYIPALFGAQYLGIIKLIMTGNDMTESKKKVRELTNLLSGTTQLSDDDSHDTDRRRLQQQELFQEYTESCMNQEAELENELEDDETCTGFLGLDLDDFKIKKLNAALVVQPILQAPTVISFAEKVINVLKYIIYVFVGTCLVVSILGKMYAKRIGSDNVKPFGILFFSLYTWDFYSDVMFCVRLYDATEWILFTVSIIFIFIPWSMNLLQLFQAQKKWTSDNTVREGVGGWFVDWSIVLVCAVGLSGNSFGAIELANSNLFGIDLFSMGLNPRHLKIFQSKRFYSSVLGENIPQLIVQIYFLTLLGSFDEATFIALLSSSICLILSVVDIWSAKRLVNVMDDHKDNKIDINCIEFTIVNNDEIEQEKQILLTKPRALAKAIAETLVVDVRTVEVYQLIAAENGIKVGFAVYAIHCNLHSMVDDLIQEEKKLQLLLANHWALKQYPYITQIQEGHIHVQNTNSNNNGETEYTGKVNNINQLNPHSESFVAAESPRSMTSIARHIPLNRMKTSERNLMKVKDPEYKRFLSRPISKSLNCLEAARSKLENGDKKLWQTHMNNLEEYVQSQTEIYMSHQMSKENSIIDMTHMSSTPLSITNDYERNNNQHQQWTLYLTNIGKLLDMRYKLQSKYNENKSEGTNFAA